MEFGDAGSRGRALRKDGILFHAKHAYMPNRLGYCGPDRDGTILSHLEDGNGGEELVKTLEGFEAAYPFLRLISRNSSMDVFDYRVPEAYWIGNDLLRMVDPLDFLRFSREELNGSGMKSLRVNFKRYGGRALPHHTLYVMGTYLGRDGGGEAEGGTAKIANLMDNCRISWGTVRRVEGKRLTIRRRPLVIREEKVLLGALEDKVIHYDPGVEPFGAVRPGDVVSVHWNYACEVLTPRQVRNIVRFTRLDLDLANNLVASGKSAEKG